MDEIIWKPAIIWKKYFLIWMSVLFRLMTILIVCMVEKAILCWFRLNLFCMILTQKIFLEK